MIKVQNVNFYYGQVHALDKVSFELSPNSITALVGPNGAGKSTLMRCLATLDRPFSGQLFIDNINIYDHPHQAQKLIGYLSDFFGLYEELTVEQSLQYFSNIRNLSSLEIDKTIEMLSLQQYRYTKASQLSRGWRQRLAIAQAILHKPKILILDEPAAGLDPEARVALSKLFVNLKEQGMTLLVSSHILAELQDYATEVLIIRQGKILEHYTLEEHTTSNTFHIEFIQAITESTKGYLYTYKDIKILEFQEKLAVIEIQNSTLHAPALLKALIKQNIDIYAFYPLKQSLQDSYLEKVAQHA